MEVDAAARESSVHVGMVEIGDTCRDSVVAFGFANDANVQSQF